MTDESTQQIALTDIDADEQVDALGDAYVRWSSRVPPDLSMHPAAVVVTEGIRVLIADRDDVVVYNVYASILPGRPYLQTVKGRIVSVDQARGIAQVFDVDRMHRCFLDFSTPRPKGDEVRFPAGSLKARCDVLVAAAAQALAEDDLDTASRCRNDASRIMARISVVENEAAGRRKVGRPKRVRTPEELRRNAERAARKAAGEVKRGRPVGSTNRPKDVVQAERKKLMDERRARREARNKKKMRV